jgi:hypothetical protein
MRSCPCPVKAGRGTEVFFSATGGWRLFILGDMTIERMDNVAIVVKDLDGAVAFFAELGTEMEGKGQVEGL